MLLAAEYSDEEIGELDAEDPRVVGEAELDAFDDVLDEYLSAQKAKFVQADEIMDTGSSRAWARPAPDDFGKLVVEAATSAVDAAGNGGNEEVEYSSDGSIEEHPFFDGLKQGPSKEREWDAETILSTYTTTDNHPTTVSLARKPRRGAAAIQLHARTGLPEGTLLPAAEERLRLAEAQRTAQGDECDDEEEEDAQGEVANAGEARPRGETADAKRERKAAAKAAKAERRVEKKGTKEAFRTERAHQVRVKQQTAQLPATSLSGWS